MAMNQQKMMKQMQKLQEDMARAQEELLTETVQASAGGGAVTATVTGGQIYLGTGTNNLFSAGSQGTTDTFQYTSNGQWVRMIQAP